MACRLRLRQRRPHVAAPPRTAPPRPKEAPHGDQRRDNALIAVDDLDTALALFAELGKSCRAPHHSRDGGRSASPGSTTSGRTSRSCRPQPATAASNGRSSTRPRPAPPSPTTLRRTRWHPSRHVRRRRPRGRHHPPAQPRRANPSANWCTTRTAIGSSALLRPRPRRHHRRTGPAARQKLPTKPGIAGPRGAGLTARVHTGARPGRQCRRPGVLCCSGGDRGAKR